MKMVFPEDEPRTICDDWCLPLHQVEKAAEALPQAKYFDVNDFMIMMRLEDEDGAITLFKHIDTRAYLNADEQGRVYQYVPPGHDQRHGRRCGYVPTTLVDALEDLRLWELPWMRGELEEGQLGTSWEDR